MKIEGISKVSATGLQTISPDKTVHEASQKLVEFNIGALPVCDAEGGLVGIITERDILRETAKHGSDAVGNNIAGVMTRNVMTCTADDDIETAMRIMTERRIRHLPVLANGDLVDIISIGDLVKAKLDGATEEIRLLRDYVAS
jgi:CBS domain-containing protein